jgi:hypothetical protein
MIKKTKGRKKMKEEDKVKYSNFNISVTQDERIELDIVFDMMGEKENLRSKRAVLHFLIESYKNSKK